jgi:hypothetical protein
MQVEEYLIVCLMFLVAFLFHSAVVARSGDDKLYAPVEARAKNVTQGRVGGLLNVRIQCNRLT